MSSILDSKTPEGPLADKWQNFKANEKLVNPANKRKFKVIVILLSVPLVGGVGGVIVLFYVQEGGTNAELRKQMAALMAKQGVAATPEEKQRLAKRLDELNKRLAKATPAATGKQIELKVTVDPTVVGGIVTTIGDTVIDGSVRSRIVKLREAF